MTPAIGRVVHFHTSTGPQAATITAVNGKALTLHVMPPGGPAYDVEGVLEGTQVGSWSWPPKV
jgi:hypothetical protein